MIDAQTGKKAEEENKKAQGLPGLFLVGFILTTWIRSCKCKQLESRNQHLQSLRFRL